ncbi:amino acid adenylation domain-containing protein, partial [Luteibacter sp. PPL201]
METLINGYRLSPQQESLWRRGGIGDGWFEVRLDGTIRAQDAHRAWRSLVAEHDMLRARLVRADGMAIPLLDVVAQGDAPWDECELGGLSDDAREKRIEACRNAPAGNGSGWLAAASLLRVEDDALLLIARVSSLCVDTPSLHLLADRYLKLLHGSALRAEADSAHLVYADWQREEAESTEGHDVASAQSHWSRVAGMPPSRFPYDDVSDDAAHVSCHAGLLDMACVRALRVREVEGDGAYPVFVAAMAVLLWRVTGRHDVCFGIECDGRDRFDDLETAVGPFTRTLPLGLVLQDDYGFDEVLQRVSSGMAQVAADQDRCPESLSATSWPVSIGWHRSFPSPGQVTVGESTTGVRLQVIRGEQGIELEWRYDRKRFGIEAIRCLDEQFRTLLSAALETPSASIDRLRMLSDSERERLIVRFNMAGERTDAPREATHRLVEAQARATPDAVAVEALEERLTYARLMERVDGVARALRSQAVRAGVVVGICMPRGGDLVVAILAVMKAGGAYLPLDPSLPPARLAAMVESAGCCLVLTSKASGDALRACPETVARWELDALAGSEPAAGTPTGDVDRNDLAYVLFTSGSTGTPKGVMVHHGGLSNYLDWCRRTYPLRAGGFVPVHSSISFDLTVTSLLAPLTAGCTIGMIPEDRHLDGLRECLESGRPISLIKITPAHAQWLGDALTADTRANVESLVVGGENLQPEHIRSWRERFPAIRIFNEYGPTETVVGCCVRELEPHDLHRRPIPVGRPIDGMRLYVLDAEGAPVATGVAGELHIGGEGVSPGYIGRDDLTATGFVPDPFAPGPGARMYRSGDLARHLPDGTLEILGRVDRQLKIRGHRIEPGEIEQALCRLQDVEQAVLLAQPDATGTTRLVAYVATGLRRAENGPRIWRDALRQELPEYMVPAHFVVLASLPLNANGKLDVGALPPWTQTTTSPEPRQPPATEAEKALASLWCELLGLDEVGREDHFFELGGHSFLLIALIERLRAQGFGMDAKSAFGMPVLMDMALQLERVGAVSRDEVPPNLIVPDVEAITPGMLPLVDLTQAEIDTIVATVPGGLRNIQDIYALSPLQEGILFHHMLGGEGDPYLSRQVIVCDDAAHLDALLSALQDVIDRHDILRTAACWKDMDRPAQVVLRHAPLQVHALHDSPVEDPVAVLLAHTDQTKLRIDLRHAPLIHGYTARESGSHRIALALVCHHLVLDHVSFEHVVAETETILVGRAAELEPALPFRDFIARTRQGSEEGDADYFRQRLHDVSEPCMPFDVDEMASARDSQVEEQRQVPDTLAARLRAQARRAGVLPAALFHAAWALVIGVCTARRDVVFGTVLSGRHHGQEGAGRTLGMFLNTLPIRVDLARDTAWDLVSGVQVALTELMAHDQSSLALAQRCSGVESSRGLFGALINYRFSQANTVERAARAENAWKGRTLVFADERSNYPFTLVVDDHAADFHCKVMCPRGIDPSRVQGYLHKALHALADALENDGPVPASSMLMSAQERQVIARHADGGDRPYDGDGTVHGAFVAHAARTPDAVAVRDDRGTVSYGSLDAAANRLAHRLIALGAGPAAPVGICLDRGVDSITAMLAVLKSGTSYLPLDVADPEARKRSMIEDAGVRIVISDVANEEALPAHSWLQVVVLDDPDVERALHGLPAHAPLLGASEPTSRSLAYVMYTSG